ncbi:hypothetical protein SGPA1_40861 [Streptomyces misionensis JCM 4497]
MLPGVDGHGRPWRDHRQVISGGRTDAPWRDLPERHGPWQTVYYRRRRGHGRSAGAPGRCRAASPQT